MSWLSKREPPGIEVFFDGDCPLCRKEMQWIRRMDRRGRIGLVDISAEKFDARSVGRSQEELMATIHGRLANGEVISGVEVFRRIYSAVGFSLLVAPTRLPLVRQSLAGIDFCQSTFPL